MRTLTLLFIALAIAGALTGHMGATLLALLWVGVCAYAHYALARVPPVQGCGVPDKSKVSEDIQSQETVGCQ